MAFVNGISEIVMLILGEIMGDSMVLSILYRDSNYIPQKKRERQYYYFMVLGSVVFSAFAINSCIIIKALGAAVFHFLADTWQNTAIWGNVHRLVLTILDIFPELSTVAMYVIGYCFCRNKFEPYILQWGKQYFDFWNPRIGLYEKDDLTGKYYLTDKGRLVCHYTLIVIFLDFVLLCILHFPQLGIPVQNIARFNWYEIVPFAGVSVFVEIAFYLGETDPPYLNWKIKRGQTRESESLPMIILANDINAKKIQDNLDVVIEYRTHNINFKKGTERYLDDLWSVEEPYVQFFREYMQRSGRKGQYQNQYIDTAVRLILGENIFFASPFYKDMGVCVFFPMFLTLLRNEKVLVLVEDTGKLEEIMVWLKEGIEEVKALTDFWHTDVLEKLDYTDVGVMAFQNIPKTENVQWQKSFLNRVSFVFVIEASGLLTSGQVTISTLADRIGSGLSHSCTWFLCDRNAENMLDLFSHLLKKDFCYVTATPYFSPDVLTAFWNTEHEPMKAWLPAQRYLGAEAIVAELAGKRGIRDITWYGEELMPVVDLKWLIGQYYAQYGKRTGQNPQQTEWNQSVECKIAGNENCMARNQFLILEDGFYNLYEVQRQYSTRAEEKVILHILSPRYMFRDYMKARKDEMQADAKYIAQFVPMHVNSGRNVALRIIRKLLEEKIPEDNIKKMIKEVEHERIELTNGIESAINDMAKLVFNEKDNVKLYVEYRNEFSKETCKEQQIAYFMIADDHIRGKIRDYFQQARYIDEEGNRKYISHLMLSGHLEQKFLPGQFAVFEGKYYEIVGIDTDSFGRYLQVKRRSDLMTGRKYYRQRRKYIFPEDPSEITTLCETFADAGIKIQRCVTDVKAETLGYVELSNWNDICNGKRVFFSSDKTFKREYKGKQFLKITLTNCKKENQEIVYWLGVLLAESFCTFFPQYYHLLSVAVNKSKIEEKTGMSDTILGYILSDIEPRKLPDSDNSFYIIEDSMEDMGLIQALESNFRRILDIIIDYAKWSLEEGDDYFTFG